MLPQAILRDVFSMMSAGYYQRLSTLYIGKLLHDVKELPAIDLAMENGIHGVLKTLKLIVVSIQKRDRDAIHPTHQGIMLALVVEVDVVTLDSIVIEEDALADTVIPIISVEQVLSRGEHPVVGISVLIVFDVIEVHTIMLQTPRIPVIVFSCLVS